MMLRLPIAMQRDEPPPGPGGVETIVSLIRARREPLGLARDLVDKYGDVVSYRIGPHTGYLLRHPDHIRHVLSEHYRSYGKNNFNYEALKPVLGNGLITSEGEEWVNARRCIQPLFHRGRIEGFAPAVSRATADMLERWDKAAARGEAIGVASEMSRLTIRVIGEVLFDVDVEEAADSIADSFNDLNEDVAYRFRNPFSLPRWVPTRRNRAFKRALRELEGAISNVIRARRSDGAHRDDLVELIVGAGRGQESSFSASEMEGSQSGPRCPHQPYRAMDDELRDQALTLMLAGYETTAALLTWTWSLLAAHPRYRDRLRAELKDKLGPRDPSPDDLAALPYVRSVIEESLRLYPPVWIISRKAAEDDEIGGYAVPAGTVVTISAYLVHRHPSFWTKPDAFRPERFLERPVGKRHPYSYLPFGAGPRQCIGSHLAVMEAMLVLARVARRYDVRLPAGELPQPDPLVTLRPDAALEAAPRKVAP